MKKFDKKMKSLGIYFDLRPIFENLNRRFFADAIKAELKWGQRRINEGKKRTIRLGSYHPSRKSITIHPCLDQAIVPTIILERILFHEMAHQKFPSKRSSSGKLLVHYREFKEFEKTYPFLKEADLWIKTNLDRLLRF